MLFNSYIFIFVFMPLVTAGYFILNHYRLTTAALAWIAVSSLFFYAWWYTPNLIILLGSVATNYLISMQLDRLRSQSHRKYVLTAGIIFNVGLLGYYKYTMFIITNLNYMGTNWEVPQIILPLAISFFTFQQIAYLVDTYRQSGRPYGFLRYVLFISFFPHLLAGPILHHKEILSQFADQSKKVVRWKNIYAGLFLFSVGLFKKVVLADWMAGMANEGYAATTLTAMTAWTSTLAYTFQIYFDFSGYCDMAMGAATLLNIRLPINFNSPYKATSIQDFWHRWHMTLSRWLRDYIYIPLGGNRQGVLRTYMNLWLVFFIGGIWHGASWTFLIWGIMHGSAIVIHRIWQRAGYQMHRIAGIICTFLFVHFTWIFFRAPDFDVAWKMIQAMFSPLSLGDIKELDFAILMMAIVFFMPNSMELFKRVDTRYRWGVATVLSIVIFIMLQNRVSEFIYFNF